MAKKDKHFTNLTKTFFKDIILYWNIYLYSDSLVIEVSIE